MSKVSGLRADIFGDIAFIYHGDVKIRSETYTVFILVDGATMLVTALAPRTKDSHETVQCLMELTDTFHCTPQSICSDIACQSPEVQDFFRRFGIKLSTGLYTPWPNRAEAAVRVFKATLNDICAQIGTIPELKQVTVRELLRTNAAVRNAMVTYGKTLLNMFSEGNQETL